MKRILGIIIVCCLAGNMCAQQFQQGELWYEVIGKSQVQVTADPTDTVYRLYEQVIVPAKVSYQEHEYCVVRLDDQAFRACHLMRTIELPEGLKEIGFQVFMNCTQLAEIRLPNTLRKVDEMAFYGCASLETVYVGKRIKCWPDMCFSDCERLKTIYHAGRRPPKSHKMSFFNCPDSVTYCPLQ